MKRKQNITFICVPNSCCSQMAKVLGKILCADVFEGCSAGTETKLQINPDVVNLMNQIHSVDMERSLYSKLLSELLEIDIAITMERIEEKLMSLKQRIAFGVLL